MQRHIQPYVHREMTKVLHPSTHMQEHVKEVGTQRRYTSSPIPRFLRMENTSTYSGELCIILQSNEGSSTWKDGEPRIHTMPLRHSRIYNSYDVVCPSRGAPRLIH